MDKIKQVQIIAANTARLLKAGKWNLTALSKDAHVDHGTISKLLSGDTLPNPTTKIITGMASSFEVAPWMLLVENFPFEALEGNPPLSRISAAGYRLLEIFEAASAKKQESMLDYAAYNLRETPKAERAIRELQAKYNTNPPSSTMC